QLFPVSVPLGRIAGGHSPAKLARWKAGDPHLISTACVRRVRDPMAIWRDLRLVFPMCRVYEQRSFRAVLQVLHPEIASHRCCDANTDDHVTAGPTGSPVGFVVRRGGAARGAA